MIQNICTHYVDFLLPTMNPPARKICSNCQSRRFLKTNDGTVRTCCNQGQKGTLLRNQISANQKAMQSKKAIITIVRMMMVCIYHMISEKKPFSPTDYEELMNSQNRVERVTLNENNVFAYLDSLGYDSSKLVKCNDN